MVIYIPVVPSYLPHAGGRHHTFVRGYLFCAPRWTPFDHVALPVGLVVVRCAGYVYCAVGPVLPLAPLVQFFGYPWRWTWAAFRLLDARRCPHIYRFRIRLRCRLRYRLVVYGCCGCVVPHILPLPVTLPIRRWTLYV